jgi:hypothetical protein
MAKKQRPPSKSTRNGATRPPYRTLYLVKQVQYKTFLRLEAALQPLGVTTTQFRILAALARGDKRSSAELSRMFGVKPQTMIKQIVSLEGSGLIERNRSNRRFFPASDPASWRRTARSWRRCWPACTTSPMTRKRNEHATT